MKSVLSDKDILAHLLSKDKSRAGIALKYVYKTHFTAIKNYILKNQGNAEDAADVFQDAVIILYDMVQDGTYKDESTILTFLYSVARNIWLKELRKTPKRESAVVNLSELAEIMAPDEIEKAVVAEQLLKNTMDELGTGCKEILASFYFRKLSMKEIMETFGLGSEQAAKTKKYRCMQQLVKLFQSKGIKKEHLIE